ncbi:MAG: hypothetical protein L0154_21530 [Chloroflexi bacterium]|nr:hypothetical protein [Chloroflexota bacterium]
MKRLLLASIIVLVAGLPGWVGAQDRDNARIRVINLFYEESGNLFVGEEGEPVPLEPAPSLLDYQSFPPSSGYGLQFGGSFSGSSATFEAGHDYLILAIAEAEDDAATVEIDETALTSAFPDDEAQLQVLHYITGLDSGSYTLQGESSPLSWYQQAAFGIFDTGYPVKAMSVPAGDYQLSAAGLFGETALMLNAGELTTVVVSGQYPGNVSAVIVQGGTLTELEIATEELEAATPAGTLAEISVFNIADGARLDTEFPAGETHSLEYGQWGEAVNYNVEADQPPSLTFVRENGFSGTALSSQLVGGHEYLLIGANEPAQSDTLTGTQSVGVLDLTYLLGAADDDTAGLVIVNVSPTPDTVALANADGELLARQHLSAEFGFGVEVDNAVMAFHLPTGDYAVNGAMTSVDVSLVAGQNIIVVIGPLDTFVIQDGDGVVQ